MQVYNPPMALQIKQKILTPANETLQEGCLPASQSHLVPPSPGITLLQPLLEQTKLLPIPRLL